MSKKLFNGFIELLSCLSCFYVNQLLGRGRMFLQRILPILTNFSWTLDNSFSTNLVLTYSTSQLYIIIRFCLGRGWKWKKSFKSNFHLKKMITKPSIIFCDFFPFFFPLIFSLFYCQHPKISKLSFHLLLPSKKLLKFYSYQRSC